MVRVMQGAITAYQGSPDDAVSLIDTGLEVLERYGGVPPLVDALETAVTSLVQAGRADSAHEKLERLISFHEQIGSGQPWFDRAKSLLQQPA